MHLGPIDRSEPPEFSTGITQAQALSLQRTDAASAAATVNKAVPHLQNQHQFDALLSFFFNTGAVGSADRTSASWRLADS